MTVRSGGDHILVSFLARVIVISMRFCEKEDMQTVGDGGKLRPMTFDSASMTSDLKCVTRVQRQNM